MSLKRGVLLRGRLTDKATGQPVVGTVEYYALADNSHLNEYPNFKRNSQITQVRTPSWDRAYPAPVEVPKGEPPRVSIPGFDGRFTIPVLHGRGLIAARAQDERYLHGVGSATIKGFEPEMEAFKAYPFYCMTVDKHVFAEINPSPGTREVALELQVDPGRTIRGRIIGPDGKEVLDGVEIRTLDLFQAPDSPSNRSNFVVTGLPAGRYRVDFIQRDRKLAGSLYLNGSETGGLTVKLQPWGTVTGRVVDQDGKPLTSVEIDSTPRPRFDPERGDIDVTTTVDAEGRFRIEGLVAGVKYDAVGRSPNKAYGPVLKETQLAPGEVKDLGDITLPAWQKDGD